MKCPRCGKDLRIPIFIENEIRRLLNVYNVPAVIVRCDSCYHFVEIKKDVLKGDENGGDTE